MNTSTQHELEALRTKLIMTEAQLAVSSMANAALRAENNNLKAWHAAQREKLCA